MEAPVLLLVEDEVLIHEMLATEFADTGGFEIVVASDGNQALAELNANATKFKAVVTDIKIGVTLPFGRVRFNLGAKP
jgi:DNA-binding response OmpR family regulator